MAWLPSHFLHHLTKLAGRLRIGSVLYMDESTRFGLGSFKALGGTYAVSQVLCRVIAGRTGRQVTPAELRSGVHSEITSRIVVTTATDFIKIGDRAVEPIMRDLAAGYYGSSPIVAGESAVAGLAALISLLDRQPDQADLELGPTSNVLLIGTQGATDPVVYERLVGRSAESVMNT